MNAPSSADFEELFRNLEPAHAKLYDIHEEEYHEAYFAFYNQVDRIGKVENKFTSTQAVELFTDSGVTSLGAINTVNGEGKPFPLDGNSLNLRSESYKEIIEIITTKSKPTHSKRFSQKTSSTNFDALKSFLTELVNSVMIWGLAEKTLSLPFVKSTTNVLGKIETTKQTTTVSMEEHEDVIEVKQDDGSINVATFDFLYDCKITKNWFSKSSEMEVKVDVKVWNFQSLGDFKEEFKRVRYA